MNYHYLLKNIIVNKNHQNILIYNNNKSKIYCKNIIINILNDLYNINNNINKLNYKNIYYEKSLYHYYIDINKIKDFITFKDLINKIIQSDNYYISYNKLIILDNFKFTINNQKSIPMPAVITDQFRISNAETFVQSFVGVGTTANYYYTFFIHSEMYSPYHTGSILDKFNEAVLTK